MDDKTLSPEELNALIQAVPTLAQLNQKAIGPKHAGVTKRKSVKRNKKAVKQANKSRKQNRK